MGKLERSCEDFQRTEVDRKAFMQSALTRRQLVGAGLGAGVSVYAAKAMPWARVLEAATARAAELPNAPVLVSVFLPGGLDLLDTLVPSGQYGTYADLRPGMKVKGAVELGGGIAANPGLSEGVGGGIVGLYQAGKIGFLPGIDYANPDLSHFNSRHFWESGSVTAKATNGWLGRWLDHNGSADNPLQGITADYTLSPLLRSASAPVAAVSSPDDAQFWMPGVWGDAFDMAMDTYSRIAASAPGGVGPNAAYGAARSAKFVGDALKPYVKDEGSDPLAPAVAYPKDSRVAEQLQNVAGMLSIPLGVRVVTVDVKGEFDTHDNQDTALKQLLPEVSSALSSFQADLEARGIADRVLTFVWSEFGRRPQQNESNGTDHGAGGIAWVQGNRARSGILSDYPDLKKLDSEDNLKVTVDFRQVYTSLLEQWLGSDAAQVIPGASGFRRIGLVR